MTRFRHILFDLDGTITDSRAGIIESYRAAIMMMGYQPDPRADLSSVIGPPIHEVIATLLAPYGDCRIDEAVEAHWKHYKENGIFQSTLYDDISELLSDMKRAGYRLYVATAKRTECAIEILDRLSILDCFEGVYGSGSDGSLEDKSTLVQHLLDRERIIPSEAAMVGDRSYDVAAARNNGLFGIGVLWGYGSAAELVMAAAHEIVTTPRQLRQMFLARDLVYDLTDHG